MKITKEQLKRIIKEELSAIMEEPKQETIFDKKETGNRLIDNHGYETYLQAPYYIKGDFNSPLDGPWNQAEIVKQSLRNKLSGVGDDANKGLEAIRKLDQMTKEGHDSINAEKQGVILKFLQTAEEVLSGGQKAISKEDDVS